MSEAQPGNCRIRNEADLANPEQASGQAGSASGLVAELLLKKDNRLEVNEKLQIGATFFDRDTFSEHHG